MAKIILHRKIRIITLDGDEAMQDHCKENDIALVEEAGGWSVYFIGEGGEVSGYDQPFPTHQKALFTAKAAAEFAAE